MFLTSVVLGIIAVGCKQPSTQAPSVEIKTEEDKVVYALGQMIGENLKNFRLSDDELAKFNLGMNNRLKGQGDKTDIQTYMAKVQAMGQERSQLVVAQRKEEGKKFLEEFVAKEGATKTESGLAYKILVAGDASMKPELTDTVEVNYEGKLIDGTSFEKRDAQKFALNRLVKGWGEGLQLIGKGGKIKLVIPSDIGYGDRGAGPQIAGGSTLVFEVELLNIEKPATDSGTEANQGNVKAPEPKKTEDNKDPKKKN